MVARKAVRTVDREAGKKPTRNIDIKEVIIEEALAPEAYRTSRMETVGGRVRDARLNKNMTQLGLSKVAGLQRSAIAQWERDDSVPSIAMLKRIAPYLGVAPEWLGFGIDYKPIIKAPSPEEMGYALVSEVRFGSGPADRETTQTWALPTHWLRTEVGATDASSSTCSNIANNSPFVTI